MELPGQRRMQNVVHERGFPCAGNAGDAGHDTQGKVHINPLEVVGGCALDGNMANGFTALWWNFNGGTAGQVVPGDASSVFFQ